MSGTNYYHRKNTCKCCGRYDEMHIGKASFGWSFGFHGTDKIKSIRDWKKELQEGQIFDEYGREILFDEFFEVVEDGKELHKHAVIYSSPDDWLDEDGWSFSGYGFS